MKRHWKRAAALLVAGLLFFNESAVLFAEDMQGAENAETFGEQSEAAVNAGNSQETWDEEDAGNTQEAWKEEDAGNTREAWKEESTGNSQEVLKVGIAQESASVEVAANNEEEALGKEPEVKRDASGKYVEGELLIFYEKGTAAQEAALQAVQENEGEQKETIAEAGEYEVAVVELSEETSVMEAVETYRADSRVAFAMPNYILDSCGEETEELTLQQSAVNDTDYASRQWYLDQVQAEGAWNLLAQTAHEKIKVAVLDTGVDVTHPDLVNVLNRESSAEILSADPFSVGALQGDGYQQGTAPSSENITHGTHVAGILGAEANNGVGTAGIASAYDNSVLDLMVLDIFPNNKTNFSYLFKGIEYAKEQGARIINLSLGINFDLSDSDTVETISWVQKIFDGYQQEGMIIVCAAGNGDTGAGISDYGNITCVPGDLPSTISVININRENKREAASNYGSLKDVSAPGTSIWSTINGSSYGELSGTSMSAPVVTGIAAMMLSVNPNLSFAEVRDILRGTATDIGAEGFDAETGYGLVNAEKAVYEAGVLAGKFADVDIEKDAEKETEEPEKPKAEQEEETLEPPHVQYKTHVQTYGWQEAVSDGAMAGTSGESKRMEAIQISLEPGDYEGGIEYLTHVQTYGWETEWKSDGALAGTTGQGKRLEAIRIRLTGKIAEQYDVYYQVHVQTLGWLGWAKNGQTAGTAGYSRRVEAVRIQLVKKGSTDAPTQNERSFVSPTELGLVTYSSHVQSYGWMDNVADGAVSGTKGKSKRMEAIRIYAGSIYKDNGEKMSGTIQYRAHSQSYGWMNWVSSGQIAGTIGQSKRLEAIQIKLTGELAENYDVFYRVHCSKWGDLGWAKNGETAGTTNTSRAIESIEIKLVKKTSTNKPTSSVRASIEMEKKGTLTYETWGVGQGWSKTVTAPTMSGTVGKNRNIGAVRIRLNPDAFSGGVTYRVYMQGKGWQPWVKSGEIAGSTSEGKRVEAIQIKLTGEIAQYCDVYYSTCVQEYGWLNWAKNGGSAGTVNCSYRMEALQLTLAGKTASAPGSTSGAFKTSKKNHMIASFTTDCTGAENSFYNMSKALTEFNGVTVKAGETLSFFGVAGPCGAEQGYLPSNVVGGIGYGGGICQASTTLYGAVLRAGLTIVERRNHSVPSTYVPIGQDAMVDWGTSDFKFRNDYSFPIRLVTYISGRTLHVEVYGEDPGWFDSVVVNSWWTGSNSAAAERVFYKNGNVVKVESLLNSYYY